MDINRCATLDIKENKKCEEEAPWGGELRGKGPYGYGWAGPQETEELGFFLGQILPPGTFLFFIRGVGLRKDPFYARAQPESKVTN